MMSTRKKRIKPVEEATSFILLSKDKPGIEGKYIDSEKGRGVFATQPIEPGAFVVEYKGDLISVEECQSRQYSETESTFLFEFEWQKHRYCIDASKEDGSLGRLVNDDNKSPNCTIKQIAVNNRPHLCLFAVKKIEIGTEIDYSYGDSKWPWRNKVPISQSPAVEVEYKKLPAAEDTSPNESDFADNVGTQVPINQSPAVEVESKKLPAAEDTSPNVSYFADNVGTQVPISQSLAVEVESKKLPAAEDTSPNMSNFADNVGTQVFTSQATSLVDYSDSDDSMEVAPEKLDSESDSSGSLNHSDSTFVDETDDPDSLKAHSSEQSYFVPKLRRTKSILTPIGSDDSSADSEDDYIPHPSEESTESDGLELSMKAKAKKKSTSAVKNRSKSTSQSSKNASHNNCGSRESTSFGDECIPQPSEASTDSNCSSESSIKDKEKNKVTSTVKSRSKSISRNVFASSQSRSKTSKQSSSGSSESTRQNFETIADENEETILQTHTKKDSSVPLPFEEEPCVYVNPVLKGEGGSRKYNKKHRCFYCGQVVQKMSRHLWRKHSDQVDVAKACSLPKNSSERRRQLDYIRNKGNFEHNIDVLEKKRGKLIPCKQPTKKSEGGNFAHCVYCYGLFTKRVMWRHFQVCQFKPQCNPSKQGKSRVQALCAFAEPVPHGYSNTYWKFLSNMNQDDIAVAVKKDPCLLKYGYRLFKRVENVISQHQFVRQKLRELGRLLREVNKSKPVKTVRDLIKPGEYNLVVNATGCLAGLNEETGKYKIPSLARKVGHSLHSLAMYLKSEGLKENDKQAVQDADDFAALYKESWKFDIGGLAKTQLDQTKWNAPQLLPFTEDVKNLHSFLSEKQQQDLNALKENPSPSRWKKLAKVSLTQVILFNRRRAGEVSRMPLSVYLSKDTSETHEDVNLALTALEQKLCKHFLRMTIVGKRGRKVPVLITPLMRESLDTLTEKREECGVLKENDYLFALPHSIHYLRGSDCIRQFVNECKDIRNPQALTSTKLRKHIATLSAVLNLKTTELDQLADFLGHNIAVHRQHYRLPEGTLQLAKISKVLLALERGRLGEYKGKSLDEIRLDVNETVDIECSQKSSQEMEGSEEDMDGSQEKEGCPKSCRRGETVDIECSQKSSQEMEGSEEDMDCSQEKEDACETEAEGRESARKRGKKTVQKRSWTQEESAAVERHLGKFMRRNKVPGKRDCESCIAAESEVLETRDWKAVKYFIKNRISAMRRKLQ